MREWKPIATVPLDRYVLLYSPDCPAWDGNMEVGRWYGDEKDGCFWSCGGPNGGLELNGSASSGHYDRFTHWMDLPDCPKGETADSATSGGK